MKSLKFVLTLSLLISSSAFASGSLTGAAAEKLSGAIEATGAAGDCGHGTCGTDMRKVACTTSADPSTLLCLAVVTDATGNDVDKDLRGAAATGIFEALKATGNTRCSGDSCVGFADTIDCTYPNDPSSTEGVTCSISN